MKEIIIENKKKKRQLNILKISNNNKIINTWNQLD